MQHSGLPDPRKGSLTLREQKVSKDLKDSRLANTLNKVLHFIGGYRKI